MGTHWKGRHPRVAFISGASSGIGAQMARLLWQEGCSLALFDLHLPDPDELVSWCPQHAEQQLHVWQMDVCDEAGTCDAVNDAVALMGAPDLVFHSAGVLRTAPFAQMESAIYRQVVEINLFGSRNLVAAVSPHLGEGAHLALMASLSGLLGSYGHAAYSSSKFAVVGLAEVLRLEFAPRGISVSVICPGEISTPLLDHERVHGSAATKQLNAFAGVLSVEDACRMMMTGLRDRRFMITPGTRVRIVHLLVRYVPRLLRRIADRKLRHALAKNGGPSL